jgi:hypothetical protein
MRGCRRDGEVIDLASGIVAYCEVDEGAVWAELCATCQLKRTETKRGTYSQRVW